MVLRVTHTSILGISSDVEVTLSISTSSARAGLSWKTMGTGCPRDHIHNNGVEIHEKLEIYTEGDRFVYKHTN